MKQQHKTINIKLCLTYLISLLCITNVTAQECNDQFKVQENGTIFDANTQLVWMACPLGLSGHGCKTGEAETMSWITAIDTGLKSQWRMPTKNELLSLIDRQCKDSKFNTAIFPNTPSTFFWTASKRRDNSQLALAVNFADGLEYDKNRFQYYFVRFVKNLE